VRRELAAEMVAGAASVANWLRERAKAVEGCDDPLAEQVALSAGCGDQGLADLCISAARIVGVDRLRDGETFQLADCVIGQQGRTERVVTGVAVGGGRLSVHLPEMVDRPELLLIDGDLKPHQVVREALAHEIGIRRQAESRDEFADQMRRVSAVGVGCLVVAGEITPEAEELLIDAKILAKTLAVADVEPRTLAEVAEHTGATPIKPSGLRKTVGELRSYLGAADRVTDLEDGLVIVEGGRGRPAAFMIVGGATPALASARACSARSVASSVQAGLRGGVLPGGGAAQLSAAEYLQHEPTKKQSAGGIECLRQGLRAPAMQLPSNAARYEGAVFSAVERAHTESDGVAWGIDARSGQVVDMYQAGVVDAADVVCSGIEAAASAAAAVITIGRSI
jgi:chaperonin GroEL (HSP60 family)